MRVAARLGGSLIFLQRANKLEADMTSVAQTSSAALTVSSCPSCDARLAPPARAAATSNSSANRAADSTRSFARTLRRRGSKSCRMRSSSLCAANVFLWCSKPCSLLYCVASSSRLQKASAGGVRRAQPAHPRRPPPLPPPLPLPPTPLKPRLRLLGHAPSPA